MSNVNKELAFIGLKGMSDEKKQVLHNALIRNSILTSCPVLENCFATIYIEGWYFQFKGVRSSFNVYFADNDGEMVQMRKPHESKLHKIYDDSFKCWESDFRKIGVI